MTGLGVPVVTLVVGGDKFTPKKVMETVNQWKDTNRTNNEQTEVPSKDVGTPGPVVIVNGSGDIANMLAGIYKELERNGTR